MFPALPRLLIPLCRGCQVLRSVPEEQRAKESVKDVLNKHLDLGPTLFEHALLCADIKPSIKLSEYGLSAALYAP